jgi:hypothetical protein
MPQLFSRSMNTVSRVTLFGSVALLAFVMWACLTYTRSSYGTGMGIEVVQPIAFSHQHHVGLLGIDCRYCHTSVEHSSFAGIPPTKTCMNCHSQIWTQSEMLAPVRDSYRTGKPLDWKRVYNTPDFVYFDHSIHVQKGVGCASCHGRVDEMPFTYQVPTLLMEWCLDCHRHPELHLRPRAEVFNMKYEPPADQLDLGRKLLQEYDIQSPRVLTSCTVCHR